MDSTLQTGRHIHFLFQCDLEKKIINLKKSSFNTEKNSKKSSFNTGKNSKKVTIEKKLK